MLEEKLVDSMITQLLTCTHAIMPSREMRRTTTTTRQPPQVPHEPQVERRVPPLPELADGLVVGHAAHLVLRWQDAVCQGPEAEEAPEQQELEPH